jgi:predicted lipoprotein with Yx(FWY)xxD motif
MEKMTMRIRWWAAPVLAGAAAVLTACGSSSPATSASSPAANPTSSAAGGPTTGSTVVIDTHSTSLGTVLTNAQGHTLYWFAIDTPTSSMCTGTCATYWPPVIGKPAAGSGVSLPKAFGTITRSDGKIQATYNGHPLYTYAADTTAGMTSGNGSNLSGGLWWAMTPNGTKPGAAPASSPSSSGGGGYGY